MNMSCRMALSPSNKDKQHFADFDSNVSTSRDTKKNESVAFNAKICAMSTENHTKLFGGCSVTYINFILTKEKRSVIIRDLSKCCILKIISYTCKLHTRCSLLLLSLDVSLRFLFLCIKTLYHEKFQDPREVVHSAVIMYR